MQANNNVSEKPSDNASPNWIVDCYISLWNAQSLVNQLSPFQT